MKQTKTKRDAKIKQPRAAPRDVDVAALEAVRGGSEALPGQHEQHNETFVRGRRAKRAR